MAAVAARQRLVPTQKRETEDVDRRVMVFWFKVEKPDIIATQLQ